MNTCVGRITRRQTIMGGFSVAFSPFPVASEDDDDDFDGDADEDDSASSPSDDEMST